MTLVGKAGFLGHLGVRKVRGEQRLGPLHAQMVLVGMGRQAVFALEKAQQMGRAAPSQGGEASWAIKVDRLEYLQAMPPEALAEMDEIVIDISRPSVKELLDLLPGLRRAMGRDGIRLALPMLARSRDEEALREKIARLRGAGWSQWEVSNLYGWGMLGLDPASGLPDHYPLSVSADWPVYSMNRLAVEQILEMGAERVALSPEDGFDNMKRLLQAHAEACCVIVYQDTPLFISESCALANLSGGCPGKAHCSFVSMEMASAKGENIEAVNQDCRTIALNKKAFCIASSAPELKKAGARRFRADFAHRAYRPDAVPDLWRLLRQGKKPTFTHSANFETALA